MNVHRNHVVCAGAALSVPVSVALRTLSTGVRTEGLREGIEVRGLEVRASVPSLAVQFV
jgi:hypothetical protein